MVNPRQCADLPHRAFVRHNHFFRLASKGHHGDVDRQHVPCVEAGLCALQFQQRLQQHAGARQKHERRGNLRDGENAQPAIGSSADAHAARRKTEPTRGADRGQARNERQQHSANHRQQCAHPKQTGIYRQIQRPNRETGGITSQHRDHRAGRQHAQQSARATQHQALCKQGPSQVRGTGAQRRADAQFAFPSHGPRQDQVGHIRAGNNEHQSRSSHQNQQHGSRAGGNLIAQQGGVNAEVGLGGIIFRVLFDHRLVYGLQFRARRFQRRPRLEASEKFRHAVDPARDHGCRHMVRTGHHVGDDLGLGGIRHRWFQHANNRGRTGAEPDVPAQHRGIALELRLPESPREHHDARRVRAIIARVDQTTQHRAQSHHVEIGATHHAGANLPGFAQTHHGEANAGEIANGGQ